MTVMKDTVFAWSGVKEAVERNLPIRPLSFLASQDDFRELKGLVGITLVPGDYPQVNGSEGAHRSEFEFHIVGVERPAPKVGCNRRIR
jgi:hypothetical protein